MWKELARSVLALAIADLAMVRLKATVHDESAEVLQDDAAWFFADRAHEEWAYMAGLDPDEVLEAAQMIAERMKWKQSQPVHS